MLSHRRPSESRPIVALSIAVALHGALLAALARFGADRAWTATQPAQPLSVDLIVARSLAPEGEVASSVDPGEAALAAPAMAIAAAAAPAAATRPSDAPETVQPAIEAMPSGSSSAPGQGTASRAASRRIDLGLGGSLTRALMFERFREPRREPEPSVGLLSEGLASIDATRGMSRSAPAVAAARGAALELAPRQGIALFDVAADERGVVTAVTLVSFASDEVRWRRVADAMRRALRGRRLRMAPGSRGLVARLQVQRGAYAKDVGDQWRTERGAAVGQKRLSPKQTLDESTQASERPGALQPTLGGSVGAKSETPTRVALLSERIL
jgi:hypothetical protein